MSRLPPPAPQKDGQPPCKVVLTGIDGQPPAAVTALARQLRSAINKFYLTSRQNSDNSQGDVWHAHTKLPDSFGEIHYSSNQGMETMRIALNPKTVSTFSEEIKEKVERPWDWVVIEMVVSGLITSDVEKEGIVWEATCTNMESNPDYTYPIETPNGPFEDYDEVLAFAEGANVSADVPVPAPGLRVRSLRVDLRRFGREEVRITGQAKLIGNLSERVIDYYARNLSVFTTGVINRGYTALGTLHWEGYDINTSTSVIVSGADLWGPADNGPGAYSVSGNNLTLRSGSGGHFENRRGGMVSPLPVSEVWLDRNFRIPAANVPLPLPTPRPENFEYGSSSNDVIDPFLKFVYAEVLETWPVTGLVKRYEVHAPSAPNPTLRTGPFTPGGPYTYKTDVRKQVIEFEFADAEPIYKDSPVPGTASAEVTFRWAAGWGAPPPVAVDVYEIQNEYSQWVLSIDPITGIVVSDLPETVTIFDEGEDAQGFGTYTDLGTFVIDRYLHAFTRKPA